MQQFETLVEILRESVQVNEKQSMRSTGGNEPISPEVCVARFLGFLYDDRIMALHHSHGISPRSVNRIINKALQAVVDSQHALLVITLPDPKNCEELYKLAQRWESLSSTSLALMKGHLAALNGWLAGSN